MKEINDFIYLNEKKEVWLRSEILKSSLDLWKLLKKLGFTRHYDIFSFDRKTDDGIEIWQTNTIVGVSVFQINKDVYFKGEESYDAIQLNYLLATLPVRCISIFTKLVGKISNYLNLNIEYNGNIISEIELEKDLLKSADEFAEKVAETGSQTAAILVQSAYPRKIRN